MRYDDELDRMRSERSRRQTATNRSRRKSNTGRQSSGTNRRSGKKKDPRKSRRVKIIILEVLVLIALLIFAAYSFVANMFTKMKQEDFNEEQVINSEITEEQKENMKGYWTFSCFGLDPRSGNLSDVNMICNINRETGEIKLVSIFRDTYLNISDKNSYNKINAAYSLGGPTQSVAALNKNLGLNMTQYASFSWEAVAQAINILGGVDIEISDAEFYYMNAFITETVQVTGMYSTQLKKSGLNHLDGVQAVAYGRLRLMDSDYARTERQRIVLTKAFEKAKKADWATLNNIIETVLPNVSSNIDINDIIPMAWDIKKYHLSETAGFPFARGEVRKAGKITDIVVPQTLETNVIQLHKFLFDVDDYQVPANVKKISDYIAQTTGLEKPATPMTGHVRTDQGIIPKKKTSTNNNTNSSTTAAPVTEEETNGEESQIAYETDEFGNIIDPPEDFELEGQSSSAQSPSSQASSGSSLETGQSLPYETGPGYPGNGEGPGAETLPKMEETTEASLANPLGEKSTQPSGPETYGPGGSPSVPASPATKATEPPAAIAPGPAPQGTENIGSGNQGAEPGIQEGPGGNS